MSSVIGLAKSCVKKRKNKQTIGDSRVTALVQFITPGLLLVLLVGIARVALFDVTHRSSNLLRQLIVLRVHESIEICNTLAPLRTDVKHVQSLAIKAL